MRTYRGVMPCRAAMISVDRAPLAAFATMSALMARQEGARFSAGKGTTARPCDPDDVVRCLDHLYRQRRIDLSHARVLRIWGERQIAPSATAIAQCNDRKLWLEALQCLEWPLRAKGIVA